LTSIGVTDLGKRDIAVLTSIVLLFLLGSYSAMTADVSDGEHAHQPAWFILSMPAAIYLIQALIRSEEFIVKRGVKSRRTG